MGSKQLACGGALSLASFVDEARPHIEYALAQHLPIAGVRNGFVFNEALHDAIFPGGRRLRAILALLSTQLVVASEEEALTAVVAVEYLHSSSLIFDDLPAMDNAVERRGRACLHLRYGEGITIVVALALMNAVYRIIASRESGGRTPGNRALRELTECLAHQIASQAADLAMLPTQTSGAANAPMRYSKTSALFRLAATLGPILSSANPADVDALGRFGQMLGEAYQMIDDCRDIREDTALLLRGRDRTFAMQCGSEPTRVRASDLGTRAQRHLIERFGNPPSVSRLCEFAALLVGPFELPLHPPRYA